MNSNLFRHFSLPRTRFQRPNKYLHGKQQSKQRSYCWAHFFSHKDEWSMEKNVWKQYAMHIQWHRSRERKSPGEWRALLEYYYSNYVFMASLSDLYETFIVRYSPIPLPLVDALCSFFYLYLILQQMYTVKEARCANAIKMAKKRLLYRHDLLSSD